MAQPPSRTGNQPAGWEEKLFSNGKSRKFVTLRSLSHLTACSSPSFLAISRAVFLSRSIMERNSDGEVY